MARLDLPSDHSAVLALSQCKVKLMLLPECAFYISLILQSQLYWVTADEVPTAATDGVHLFFNPEFFLNLSPDERIFLVLHEIMHNVYDHLNRRGFRDAKTWNEAGDYVINDELIKRKFVMPKGGLHDLAYRDMSADEVYEKLMDKKDKGGSNQPTPWPDIQGNPPPDDQGDGQGSGKQGIGGIEQPTAQQIADAMKDLTTAAVQASKMANEKAGSIPGNIERDLDEMLHPKLPWDAILSKYLFEMNKNDYSWRKPNRRFISQGIIMPSLYSEGIGRIDFAIDTSGSVSDDDFNRFMSEIGHVFLKHKPKEVGVMQFDSVLQSHDRVVNPQDFLKIQFKGGGGTNIKPVLKEFKEKSPGKALIILTDGYLSQDISWDPGKDVIWCIYNNPHFEPLFGRAIHFEN